MPVYNEKATLLKILEKIDDSPLSPGLIKEVIIVDDASTDGTRDILKTLEAKYKILYQPQNQGKGSAVKKGLLSASGDFVIIQDADLEYDPSEYQKLLEPLLSGAADVVFGSRFIGSQSHRVLYFWHYLGNRLLTLFSNMLTNLNLTDMETCYKVFTRQVADKIKHKLTARRFGIEPEITARVKRFRIYEVGISYFGRTYEEGKHIGWKDGIAAFWYIIKYNLF